MSADPLFDLTGRVVLVTGGLGQIGTAFVRALHARGARVAVGSRSVTATALHAAVPGADPDRLLAVPLDITEAASVSAAVEQIVQHWGGIDGLVNNAGLDTQPGSAPEVSGPFEGFPVEVFREVVEVNLVGTFLVTQAVGAAMRERDGGSIVNVGSIYGMVSPVQDLYTYAEEETGVPFIKPVAYSAAKSGVYNLTRYCATYWGRHGIRVNTLTPSGVRRETQHPTFQERYTGRIPIGRMAEADEFDAALVFLLADGSRYMTGANLVVDGGWTAW
ncbi:SDR family oxidoreductase [Agromyces silvae]|uniref:SDR family oxidoreductase n=1 Tax=Agromyces silvae TaxID=3388266 RepID=UPI00280AC6E4|nr:SDR family oxidoreductase [Agromyces protaetiae]